MSEAARQQSLLAALHAGGGPASALRETGDRATRGLAAYRANAEASAERALAALVPTVRAMLGPATFAPLCRQFLGADPPVRGDLAEWGSSLPGWLNRQASLAPWPWLPDCARLDLAIHHNERAADAEPDIASLSLLGSVDPSALRLELMPGCALVESPWPIATIHRAHSAPDEARDSALADMRLALATRRAEQVLVARKVWRGTPFPLDAATARWTRAVLAGTDLGDALDAAGPSFDFAAWLATALREAWIAAVRRAG